MSSDNKHAANEFEILSFVENGIGSKIYDVVQKQRNRKYTMEVVPRKQTTEEDMMNSRLHKHSHFKAPSCYLTQLKYSFQTKSRKYFILSHLDRERSLGTLLQKKTILNKQEYKFIVTEILVAIETLQRHGIPYGNLTVNDIYFDTKGHVIINRTYNGQTYWTKNECYGCHRGKCKNQYHKDTHVLSEKSMINDWNSIGQLLVHIMTGKQMLYSAIDNQLDSEAKDFARLLLQDNVNIIKLKNHLFLRDINWGHVTTKEIEVPDSLKVFVLDVNYRQLKDKSNNNNIKTRSTDKLNAISESRSLKTSLKEEKPLNNYSSMPRILVEGVRKQRAKSEEPAKKISSFKEKKRCRSYNQDKETFERSRSNSCDANSLLIPVNVVTKSSVERKKSIDTYQKRLQEISNVLDKNRIIMQSIDQNNSSTDKNTTITNHDISDNIGQQSDKSYSPSSPIYQYSSYNTKSHSNNNTKSHSNNNTKSHSNNNTEFPYDKKSLVEKIYSENDAIRTILSKYGLLKQQQQHQTNNTTQDYDALYTKQQQTNNTMKQSIPNTETPVVRQPTKLTTTSYNTITPKMIPRQYVEDTTHTSGVKDTDITANSTKTKIEGKRRTSRKEKSPSQSQSLYETNKNVNKEPTNEFFSPVFDEQIKPTQSIILHSEEQMEASQSIVLNTNEQNLPDTNNATDLIDKLNGLRKSKTFYTRRPAESNPRSPQMKRHFSDPTMKPTIDFHSPHSRVKTFSVEQSRPTTAPQTLLAVLHASAPQKKINNDDNNDKEYHHYNTMFVKGKSTSCDSGLNEPIDEEKEDHVDRIYIERNDSGVGGLSSRDMNGHDEDKHEVRVWRSGGPDLSFLRHEEMKIRANKVNCFDCGKTNIEESFPDSLDTLCKQCGKSRIERRQSVTELIETEVNYGEDLRILKEEFYIPIKLNSICTTDEISKLFLNLQELVDVNAKLCMSLQYGLEECLDQDDTNYMTLAVGEVFLNNVELFEAYELYCAKQNESLDLLASLQKKSDLLRIFLTVSSQENNKLRKMDLKSFLTMPVQRIMKYPLLLSRIYKHTPKRNADRKTIKEAQSKIDKQIAKINEISKTAGNLNTPRVKKSNSFTSLLNLDSTNINNVTKMISTLQDWKLEETVILQQDDFEIINQDLVGLSTWSKSSFKKILYLRVLLCVNGAPENYQKQLEERLKNEGIKYIGSEIKGAVIVLLKQKNMEKCLIYKKPIKLRDCVLSQNLNIPIALELSETDKQPVTFVAHNTSTCTKWKKSLDFVISSFQLKWRQRRGGRSNIMIPTFH